MKQIVKLLTLMCRKAHLPAVMLLALLSGLSAHADVVINETTFPDANFRNFILSQSYGQDGVLTDAEIAEVDSITCSKKEIASLEGIGNFTAIKKLICDNNQLISLDLNTNVFLDTLYCEFNKLTMLNISNCTELIFLSCSYNQLTVLDVSNNITLKELDCGNNQLSDLDITKNAALIELSCGKNCLSNIDLSDNIELQSLDVSRNQLSSLDISKNPQISDLNFSFNQISEIDISKQSLTSLICSKNLLTTLDLSKQTKLDQLHCHSNHLTELNLSATSFLSRSPQTLGALLSYGYQTRNLIAEAAVTADGERYYYLRLDDNTDNDQPIWSRMTETNFGGVESKFDPSRVLEWTSGGTIIEGQKRVATTSEAVEPQNVKGKILLLTNAIEDPTSNTASGSVTYTYDVKCPITTEFITINKDFTLNWTAPIPNNPITAVTDLRDGRAKVSVTYTNLAGQSSDKPFDGINIVTTRYSDGTTNATKIIK